MPDLSMWTDAPEATVVAAPVVPKPVPVTVNVPELTFVAPE